MSEKHTPTPWRVEENVNAGGVSHFAVTNRAAGNDWMPCSIAPMSKVRDIDRANAAHIVKCVNSHEELVAAARFAHMWLHSYNVPIQSTDDERNEVIAVLEKAIAAEMKAGAS